MDSLYLLLPLSVLLVLGLIGVFAWALRAEQFDDLAREGWRVLEDVPSEPVTLSSVTGDSSRSLDPAQAETTPPRKESGTNEKLNRGENDE